jgi:DNA-binding SARP family transcriptional activator
MQATQTVLPSTRERRLATTRSTVRLSLLKGFQLMCDHEPVAIPFSAQRLLAFLGLQERPLQRASVAGALWTDSSEDHAAANLRSALWRLRRPGVDLVDVDARRIQLAKDVAVDVREISAFARRLINPTQDCDLNDIDAMAFDGDVLPDWYEDWVMLERERFRQMRLHALEAVCERYTRAGRFAQAVDAGLAAVRGEPLRESANRCLIKAFVAEGNRLEARRQFERFRELLQRELGIVLSTQMEALGSAL